MRLTRRQAALGGALAVGLADPALAQPQGLRSRPWGRLADGRRVMLHTLTNRNGLSVRITDYGGIVVSLTAPDRTGGMGDVVLGFDRLEDYVARNPMFGAIVGRYANRIADGRFSLDGRTYQLAKNADGKHSLHGGLVGWDKAVWRGRPFADADGPGLELSHFSPDGDEGFPGDVEATVVYRLTHDNRLVMSATARSEAPTIINLTNHSYFNLSGDGGTKVLDHDLQIDADSYTVKDPTGIPTGEIAPVAGTPLDFRRPKPIGRDIAALPGGYDHNFIVDPAARGDLRKAAWARDPKSGRTLELWTDQPGVQLYSAHWLDMVGKGGVRYGPEHAFCLEPQHFPDSPNKPQFPSAVLRPGETYRWRCEWRLGVAA